MNIKYLITPLGRILIHIAEEIPELVLPIATTGHRWNISYCRVLTRITADSFIIEMIRRYSNNGYLKDLQEDL
jgi:hypothetical protein